MGYLYCGLRKSPELDKACPHGYKLSMGFTMKRLWLIGVLLLVLLGVVLARHAGVPSFISGNGAAPQQEQTTTAGSGTAGENAPAPDVARPSGPETEAASHQDSAAHDSSSPEKTDGASTAAPTAGQAAEGATSQTPGKAAEGAATGAVTGADAAAEAAAKAAGAEAANGEIAANGPNAANGPEAAGAEAADAPDSADAADGADTGAAPGEAVVRGTFEKGDTVSKVLESAGGQGVQQYVSAARQVFSMRSFREGQPYLVVTDKESGQVKRFEYEIDSRRRLVVEGRENPAARVEPIEYVVLLSAVEGSINDNLFQAVADLGESPQMALKLADLFGSEINFIRDLQSGDSFSVLVEKRYRDSEYKGYGRILAAHFTNKGKTFEAYLFRDGNQRAEYYNRKGENLRKTLLQAPLAFTRISSRFTNSRLHPILNYTRAHHGVDYAAPTGTPVKAVGEGVVTQRGWAGGYGNQIIVKHSASLESMYAHLSGYARGLATGQRVRQGQVIGFVGSTGLATGPHLDFRLRQSGKFIDPTKAINPRGEPVPKRAMAEFEKTVALELAYLKGEKNLSEYAVDSVVPDAPVAPVAAPEKPVDKVKSKPVKKNRR